MAEGFSVIQTASQDMPYYQQLSFIDSGVSHISSAANQNRPCLRGTWLTSC